MVEVEAQTVRRDEGTRLTRVPAQHLTQRGMKQMRRGVVAHDVVPALHVHFSNTTIAHARLP